MFKFRILLFLLFAIALHNQIRNGDVFIMFHNPVYSGVVVEIPGDNTKLISFNQNGDNQTISLPSDDNSDQTNNSSGSEIPYIDNSGNVNNEVDNTIQPLLSLSKIDFDKFNPLFEENNSKIIGCIKKDAPYQISSVSKQGNCFLSGGPRMNIALPPKGHLYAWKKVFGSTDKIINFMPIVNLESSFNENAKLYASNGKYFKDAPFEGAKPFVQGYVQTKYSYGISTDIVEQLSWMKNRMDTQIVGNCSQRTNSGEKRLLRCLYARHHGDLSGFNWYPSFNMAVRDYYISYFTKYIEKNPMLAKK